MRRIEAVTGPEAYAQIEALQARLAQAAHTVKSQPDHLQRKLEQLLEERDKLAARVTELLKGGGASVQGTSLDIQGVAVTMADTGGEDRDEIAAVADTLPRWTRERRAGAVRHRGEGRDSRGGHRRPGQSGTQGG